MTTWRFAVWLSARHEPTSLCRVCSQLPTGDATEAGAWPRRGPQYIQAGRVALEAGTDLRRGMASLRDQRRLSAGSCQRCCSYEIILVLVIVIVIKIWLIIADLRCAVRRGLVLTCWSWSVTLCMLGPVCTAMGDHLWAGKPPQYVTSHPGQLSLAILHGQAEWVLLLSGINHRALALSTADFYSTLF